MKVKTGLLLGSLFAASLCLGSAQAQGMMGDYPQGYGPTPGMMGGGRPGGPMPGGMGGPMGGMGMMDPDSMSDQQIDMMGERMASMYLQMKAIAEASDPEQRRALVREHMRNMQSFMQQGHSPAPMKGWAPGTYRRMPMTPGQMPQQQ